MINDSHLTDVSAADGASSPERRLTLRKSAKLRHRSLVDLLFREGKSLYEFPVRLTWRAMTGEDLQATFHGYVPDRIGLVQMLITVPKKKRRHAVDRVLMRRRIREAFRLNWAPLREAVENHPEIRTLSLAFIYLAPFNENYATIETRMKFLINKVARKISSASSAGKAPEREPEA